MRTDVPHLNLPARRVSRRERQTAPFETLDEDILLDTPDRDPHPVRLSDRITDDSYPRREQRFLAQSVSGPNRPSLLEPVREDGCHTMVGLSIDRAVPHPITSQFHVVHDRPIGKEASCDGFVGRPRGRSEQCSQQGIGDGITGIARNRDRSRFSLDVRLVTDLLPASQELLG